METVKELEVPCGVVVNRAGAGNGKVGEYCLKENLPILLTIPLDMEIARFYSRGVTLVEGMPQWKESFTSLFNRIQEIADERSRSLKR